MNNDNFFQVRKKGEDAWYKPERDILQVWPACMVKGAAYVCDRRGAIYGWITKQDGINSANLVIKVRDNLEVLLRVLQRCRSEDITQVMAEEQSNLDEVVYQAIMMGAASYAFREYNIKFRESRFTDPTTGGVDEPTGFIDNQYAMRHFDTYVIQAAGGA